MNKENTEIIEKTAGYVKQTLSNAESGHDWWHTYRVWQLAKTLAHSEDVDLLVVELAALLHDISDAKFNDGDESVGPQMAECFLNKLSIEKAVVVHVVNIIKNMSFRNEFEVNKFRSPEFNVVQDADRLDALGAIGIARTFSYGGFRQREMYNPERKPNLSMTKEEYKSSDNTTINHFYEKLLLLKDKMKTSTGKKIAEQRHNFLLHYLNEFYLEWEGKK